MSVLAVPLVHPHADEAAFEAVYSRYRAYLLRLALRILRSTAEVVQEVFLEFWRRPPEARCGGPSLTAWLTITTKTRCWLVLRRGRCKNGSEPITGDFGYWDSAFDTIHSVRLRLQLEAAFSKVAADHRAVLLLTYYRDMAPSQIAAHLGVPVITVRRRLKNIVGKLQRTLAARSVPSA